MLAKNAQFILSFNLTLKTRILLKYSFLFDNVCLLRLESFNPTRTTRNFQLAVYLSK